MFNPRIFCTLLIAFSLLTTGIFLPNQLSVAGDNLAPRLSQNSDILCSALPPPSPPIKFVSSELEIREQAYQALSGTTIIIRAGTYQMGGYLHIANNKITMRGETGDYDDVILDFGGMESGYFGVLVEADDVTIADLTIRNAQDHGISIQGRDRPLLYNLHIHDIGDQFVKVNPEGNGSEDGILACSRIEYTTTAPDSYTNGISAHNAHRWVIRDNEWYRIRGPAGQTGPTILFWSGSSDSIVERNLLVDCYRGIAFGNPSHVGIDHTGGIVRNNMFYSSLPHDVAVEMTRAQGWLVAFNSVLLLAPETGLTWGMEARYPESEGLFANNLSNMPIWHDRDGAEGNVESNVTNAVTGWFVDASIGDLHILPGISEVIDQASANHGVVNDYDGESRPWGLASDIGADEVMSSGVLIYQLRVPVIFSR
jgi:hypothetical protein